MIKGSVFQKITAFLMCKCLTGHQNKCDKNLIELQGKIKKSNILVGKIYMYTYSYTQRHGTFKL